MNLRKNVLLPLLALLLIIIVSPHCAKVVSPTGGEKDTLAPVMIKSIPQYASTNFNDDRILITFNEYIQLKEINQKLIVSPPMEKKPEVRLKGKSVDIRLQDTLKKNSTYTIYFSDAVQDNNEYNAIKNFEFVFSTGSTIDSLILVGNIIDSYTLKPADGVLIMLYENFTDSLPYKEVPLYVSRTDKKGKFRLSNLKSADYKIFALKDGNSNYKFDQQSEDIAFQKEKVDKNKLLSPSGLKDTLEKQVKLSLFKEESKIQALTGFSRDLKNKIAISFSKKPTGGVKIEPMGFEKTKNWYISERVPAGDTLIYWITDDKIIALDTIKLITTYKKTDSLMILKPEVDTLKLVYTEPEKTRTRKKDTEQEKKEDYLPIKTNLSEGKIAKPNIPVTFKFPQPIKSIDQAKILLYNFTDSTQIENLPFEKDSLSPRVYYFGYEWKNTNAYKLIVLSGAFTSTENKTNDTLEVNFKGANPEDFGTLTISLLNTKKSIIVELLTESGNLVGRVISKDGSKVTFNFVDPGKYRMRFIEDSNKNGKWDTGNYLKNRQPERVFMFEEAKTKGIINVRANWENEINFDLTKK